jgi:hypothetical protein
MTILVPSIFWLSLVLQTAVLSTNEFLTADEQNRFDKATEVEGRIKIYHSALKRIQETIETAAAKDDFEKVPETLKRWTSILVKSCDDIETNLKKKKRSRALIKYEIDIRQSIEQNKKIKYKAPFEQLELFNSYIAEAEAVRKRLLKVLFPN